MSTSRLNRKSQIFSQEGQSGDPLLLSATHPLVHSQSVLDRQSPNDFQHVGSDGEPITSPYRGQFTNNSNESVPIRSAQENQYSSQSYSYDFLYDPEVAKRGSDASNKQSSHSAAIRSITSPHVFMLSQDAADQNNRSATTSVAGVDQRRNSLPSSGSNQYQGNQTLSVSKYEQQRASQLVHPDDQEPKYIEEEYYIEEEVEEDVEEEATIYEESHGVETIKEVSSEMENQSPGDCEPQFIQAMGSIAQTSSLSSDKPYLDNKFSRSQKKITGSGFKDMRANASLQSLNNAESNQASLVFKPKDSDGGNFGGGGTLHATMNSNMRDSQKSRAGEHNSHTSHPSFGGTQSIGKKASISTKWGVMLEKCAMRMTFKDLFVQINRIHEIFQRKQVHQELILNNQQSQMQLKSFLDISMNTQSNVIMSQTEREAAFEDIRDRPLPQLQQELTHVVSRLSTRLADYFKGESEILQQIAQERERNQFLEAELLSQREDRVRPQISQSARDSNDDHEMAATEQFIDELEAELQQTRAELLSSKLQISDQNVEIENLKVKVNSYYTQVHQIMEERRNFEESFEVLRSQLELLQSEKLELSQMIRDRESTLAPIQLQYAITGNQSSAEYSSSGYGSSYHKVKQSASNSTTNGHNHIKTQIESLNRQVYEATKRSESLQMVETNLLEKLDRKELENLELKDGFFELKQENQMKSEVISKAQKIIEKLTYKSESDEKIMKRLNDEGEGLKREIFEKNKMLSQVNDQLKEVQAKNNHDHTLMQHTMTQELEEVRSAVREYQLELGSEKSKFMAEVASLELQLSQKESEKERLIHETQLLQEEVKKKTETAEQTIHAIKNQLQEEEAQRIELKDQLKNQVALVEENARNQIKYLQNRIKEIVEETQDSPEKLSNQKSTLSSSQKGFKSGGQSMLLTIKRELNDMCSEVLGLREALRKEGLRSDAMINQKMSKFDEFRLSVLDQLIIWDEKTAELAGLAERYSGALEEQKKLFGKLKLVVQEKDQIIVELNRQIFMREQSQETHFEQLKTELIRSNQLMKNEMLVTVSLLEEKCLHKDKKMLELEDARISFRQEFTKIFQERNFYEQELSQVSDRLKFQEAELDRLQASLRQQNQVYGEVLNIRSMSLNQTTIEHALRNLSNDAKRYAQDLVSYKDKLYQFEKDRGEERQLLNQKVASLEEQYANLQKQEIDKEEEQQLEFVQRETELIKELENAQTYANKIEADLQTRERQLKKIQDKIVEDDKKVQDAYAHLEIVAQEKQNVLAELHDSQGIIEQLEEELSESQKRLKQKDDLLSSAHEENVKERQSTNEKIATILQLEGEIRLSEEARENLKGQYAELEAKLRQVETRSMQTSKDLQDVYQELTWAKQAKNEIDREKQSLNLDISGLKILLDKNKEDLGKKDKEIEQYQKTVMRQTRELEKLQEQADIINEQKQRLHDFDNTIVKQVEQIEILKKEIKGPQKGSTATQTIDSGMLELQYARQEVIKSQQCQEVVYQENRQLKESIQRSSYEICRLIEDKRELEDLIEKLNKNISYFRAQTQNEHLMASGSKRFDQSLTGNNNSNNGYATEMVSKVLAEKENYITNLENEIDEMRKEIEIQREQLLQNETVTLEGQMRGNLSHQMSIAGGASFYQSQPYVVAPNSPQYLKNQGFGDFIYQTKKAQQKSQPLPSHNAPLRSNSREKQPQAYYQEAAGHELPHKLQAQTIYNSTLSHTLTPIDNITSSSNLKSGYFQPNMGNANNNSNSWMNCTRDNQTQASNNILLNQTHYNSQGGIYMRPQDASYLNPNQSSLLMNYQTGLNNSVATHDKSSYRIIDRYQSAADTALNGSPPEKGFINKYGNFTHA